MGRVQELARAVGWREIVPSFAHLSTLIDAAVSPAPPEIREILRQELFSTCPLMALGSFHSASHADMPPAVLAAEIVEEGLMQDHFPVIARPRGKMLPPRKVQEIRCSACGAVEERSAGVNPLPPHTMAAWCTKRGWKVVGVGRHVCPACRSKAPAGAPPSPSTASQDPVMPPKAAPKPAAAPATKTTTPVMPARPAANDDVAAAAPSSPPSPAASSALVVCYLLIEEHYDRARKAYRAGWDDERIAKETGLALPVVQERRERDFGPLVVDTTREELAAALDGLEADLADVRGRVMAATQAVTKALEWLYASEKRAAEVRALAQRLASAPVEKAA
ncbi:hypothetical protein V5F32_00910 [Xanthobacter oligotrophicus]|uniref:TniQ protein n=1 Tax=Xanthobacter oligotrophicus TaxID=2607286 RepID=A0ABW6ZQH4_9HYPH